MNVFITSTPPEMTPQASLAARVVEDMGWRPQTSDPAGATTVAEGLAEISRADLVLALIAWRRGPVPDPIAGWNGSAPWVELEIRQAFALAKPVLVMMADDDWPKREGDPRARAQIADFRAELEGLAILVQPEEDPEIPGFRSLLESELISYRDRSSSATAVTLLKPRSRLEARHWPAPDYPPRPWPVLLPYSHPDLLAGRDRDLEELGRRLASQQPILGLHAASGAGKSSLLAGGLVPRLRAQGRSTAFDRHPHEPGLAARLVGDLLAGPPAELTPKDGDTRTFLELVQLAGRKAGSPPVLILDQLEDVLRGDRLARARLGMLMAATVQRSSWNHGAPCRWLLAYRREVHGEMVRWLGNVLREARALGLADSDRLPHNLAMVDRFHVWPLAVLGGSQASEEDAETTARQAFEAVLKIPLAVRDEHGAQRYPWRFDGDGAGRLAAAFAAARLRDPEAPLVPELQVVLAELVANAEPPQSGQPTMLRVPREPAELIDGALERHLGRALDSVFAASDRVGRTRALLALYELASHERRRSGQTSRRVRKSDELIRAIGQQGREVFEKLQAPEARLVVADLTGGETVYTLSQNRLAQVIVAAVEGKGKLAVAPELLDLRRLVALRSELYQDGERETSTLVSRSSIAAVKEHADFLLTDPQRRAWWQATRLRYRQRRNQRIAAWCLVIVMLAAGGWMTWSRFATLAARKALLDQVALAEPKSAFQALSESLEKADIPGESTLSRLQMRASPLDVLAKGMGGVEPARRPRAALEAAELVAPWIISRLEPDPSQPAARASRALLANLIWALDVGSGRDPELKERALELRNQMLRPLRQRRRPPSIAGDTAWVLIPAGTFRMGSDDESEDTKPAHDVTLDAFRMLDHEVTNAEYRRLEPNHRGEDDLPVTSITWHQAMVYAAWLGGRLPTEAEWEYAALGGCDFKLCFADGREADAGDVAWTSENATDPATGEAVVQPVRQLAANPFGLYDIYGNVWEWTADWYAPYDGEPKSNPVGSLSGHGRAFRGAAYWTLAVRLSAQDRVELDPARSYPSLGFRVVIPDY